MKRALALLSVLASLSSSLALAETQGIGALGRIEPRSRVVRVSHDAGPEGARVEDLLVAEGQAVKKGERLAVFSDHGRKKAHVDEAAAGVAVLNARLEAESVRLAFAAKDYSRKKKLEKADAVSEIRREESERDWKMAAAGVAALKAEIAAAAVRQALAEEELKQATLLSPIDGTVIKVRVRPGERAGDGGIIEIADLANLDVVAEVYERDMPRLKAGQKAAVRVPGFETPFGGKVYELGYQVMKNDLSSTDPLADRDNRVVETRIALDPKDAAALAHLLYMQVDVSIDP